MAKLEGLKRVLGRMNKIADTVPGAAGAALYAEAANIMRVSLRQAPVDFGLLRRSHYITLPRRGQVELGYGASYAVFVHEITENFHEPPTKAKYLEDPINAALPGMPKRLAIRAAKLLGKSVVIAPVAPTRPQEE